MGKINKPAKLLAPKSQRKRQLGDVPLLAVLEHSSIRTQQATHAHSASFDRLIAPGGFISVETGGLRTPRRC
jgi:hypothetical protein